MHPQTLAGTFMNDTIVLLHGSATGSSSWGPVASVLSSFGISVFAPDMLGYGHSPTPTSSYGIKEEVAHLTRLVDLQNVGTLHLVTHSLGC
jgi:pimeloyl-ACP methyl ester carboxylesterase